MTQKLTIKAKLLPFTSTGKALVVAATDDEEKLLAFDKECWEKYDESYDWSKMDKELLDYQTQIEAKRKTK